MKYFKDIENEYLNKPYLVLSFEHDYVLSSPLPKEFYLKFKSVFTGINDLSRNIDLVSLSEKKKDLNSLNYEDSYERRRELESQISGIKKRLLYTYGDVSYENEWGLTYLFDEYNNDMVKRKFYTDKRDDIIRFEFEDYKFDVVYGILSYYYKLLSYIDITKDGLKEEIGKALDYMEKYQSQINISDYETVPLRDCWYILPGIDGLEEELYNLTDKSGLIRFPVEDCYKTLINGYTFYFNFYEENINKARKLREQYFAEYIHYFSTVAFGASKLGSRIYDANGVQFGMRKTFVDNKKFAIRGILELAIENLVPEDKQDEFKKLIDEKYDHFHILDSRNLPMGVYDILIKLLEAITDEEWNKDLISQEALDVFAKTKKEFATMTPETYAMMKCYFLLANIERMLFEENGRGFEHYDGFPTYIYSDVARRLVIGHHMANAIVINFFKDLYQKVDNYDDCLEYLRTLPVDEFLIRCCGFNKVVPRENSSSQKEIITSNINYEEDFKEYIKRGWKITFIPPIKVDENTKKLTGTTEICKVKRFHEE